MVHFTITMVKVSQLQAGGGEESSKFFINEFEPSGGVYHPYLTVILCGVICNHEPKATETEVDEVTGPDVFQFFDAFNVVFVKWQVIIADKFEPHVITSKSVESAQPNCP